MVNLISRFYNLTGGEILLYGRPEEGENAVAWSEGYDISRVTLHSLRTQMGIMLQDSFIFSGTIRDNIRYGRLDATDEEIEQAAKMVRAHDFIMEMEKGTIPRSMNGAAGFPRDRSNSSPSPVPCSPIPRS